MSDKKELKDDELPNATGGKDPIFNDTNRVYIEFPSIVSFLSGYYNTSELEALANQYSSFAPLIKAAVTNDIRDAVKALYLRENKTIPQNIKYLLGIN